jgi:hypothetical protein
LVLVFWYLVPKNSMVQDGLKSKGVIFRAWLDPSTAGVSSCSSNACLAALFHLIRQDLEAVGLPEMLSDYKVLNFAIF